MVTQVIAYDIDGVLTTTEGLNQYKSDHMDDDNAVGIVTGRTRERKEDFITSISPAPDFTSKTRAKAFELRKIKREYPDAETYLYVGSNARDRIASVTAGWDSRIM
jgi:hypothetical protein